MRSGPLLAWCLDGGLVRTHDFWLSIPDIRVGL